MMIKPITEYGKRNNIEREPTGRPRRCAKKAEPLVYAVRQEGNPRVKVGRTINFALRIQNYECNSGQPVRPIFQIVCASKEDTAILEFYIRRELAKTCQVFKREWFTCDDLVAWLAAKEAVADSGVQPLSVRGYPAATEEDEISEPRMHLLQREIVLRDMSRDF